MNNQNANGCVLTGMDMRGKVVLITGASRGIGAVTVRAFHEMGCVVWINDPGEQFAEVHEQSLQLAEELNQTRQNSAYVVSADVSKAEQVEAMMEAVRSRCGGLDYLVNNAAILRDRTLAKMTDEDWLAVMSVNLDGVFRVCKAALPILRTGGAIVNMASISALHGFYGQANYAAAKGGVISLSKVLSRELGRKNIRVNAVAPGVVETAMSATIPDEVRQDMLKMVPLGRFADPEEIARTVLFLCSPWASYITGQTIEVNGGWRG